MPYDEEYVREILAEARKRPRMNREQFAIFTRADFNGGWIEEVAEAARRYFSEGAAS